MALLEFWEQNSDSIIASISTVGTGLGGVITFFMRKAKTQRAALLKAIGDLATSFEEFKKEATESQQKTALRLENFQGQLNLLGDRVDTLRDETSKSEGRTETTNSRIEKLAEAVILVTAKLEAVFRIVDAPKRTSDGRINK